MTARPLIGSLYFLQVDGGGPIKIGWTYGNVISRVTHLQWGSPYELHWIGACRAPKSDEAAAHKALAHLRVRNEWFYPVEEVLSFVRARSGPAFSADLYRQIHCRLDLKERYDALTLHRRDGVRYEIVEAAKLDTFQIHRWRNGTALLNADELSRLEAAVELAEAGAFEREAAA
jgi:hypothetical protein